MQHQQLQLLAQRDPVARLAPFALGGAAPWLAVVAPSAPSEAQAQAALATPAPIIVIAMPTAGAALPTAAPVADLAIPTAEPQVIVVEVTPVPTEAPPEPTAEPVTALPAGSIFILPTATMTNQQFVDSFGPTPESAAKCAFIGCLEKP